MTRKITIFAVMFKFAILILGLYLVPNVSFAQGKVTLIVEDEVSKLESSRIQRRKNADVLVQGYRIFIGMTSSKSDASKIQSEAQEHFGDNFIAHVVYDEPNFKIYVGSYNNSNEADDAMSEIRKFYPNAKKIKMPIKASKK